jgi:cell division transport system permease protein
MRFKMLFSEAMRSIRASLSTTFAATMTVLIGMFLLGLAIALGSWVLSWSNNVKSDVEARVFMCTEYTCDDEVEQPELGAVQRWLERDPRVESYVLVSKEEALEIMREQSPDLVRDLTYTPLPHAIEVKPKRAEDVELIAADIRQQRFAGVEKVGLDRATARRIIRVGQVISIIFFGVVILLLAASGLLIANTIRLSIYARRREVEVMRLVGATNWFVRWPFVIEGILVGVVGAAVAVAILWVGKVTIVDPLADSFALIHNFSTVGFASLVGMLIAAAIVVSALGSGITLRRFLRV